MTKRPNPKVYMALAGGMLLLGLGMVFFARQGLVAEQTIVDGLHKQARSEADVRNELDKAQKKLSDCQALLTHLEHGVPDHAYVPTLLTELEKIGLENGIQVTGVKPVPKIAPTKPAGGGANAVASAPAYEDLDIQVQGVGKYANVRRFIAALNAFPKIVAARTVDLEPKSMPGQEWSDVLDVTVDLRAYVFPTKTDDSANSLSPTPTPSPGSLQVTAGPVPASGSTSSNPPFVTTQQIGTAAQIQSHKAAGSVRVPFAGPRPVRQGSPFASPSQPVKNAALGGSTR